MIRLAPLAAVLSICLSAPLAAQQAPPAPAETPPSDADKVTEPALPAAQPRSMAGNWEFSNADREKICTITFRETAAKVGKRVEFNPDCVKLFGFIPDIAGWQLKDNDFLRLLDADGNSILEFSEVENGIFEAPKPGEGILFIQNPSDLGAPPKTAEQLTGDWLIVNRTGKRVCGLNLSNTAVGEEFVLRAQPPCDRIVAAFAPVTWQADRGEIVLRAANGQSWRFTESDDQKKWERVPQTATPLWMVRK